MHNITIALLTVKLLVVNSDIVHRIQLMHDSIVKAILISQEATTRIEEFQVQLSVLQRQCMGRDRPLCDTLRLKSFAENNFVNTLIKVDFIYFSNIINNVASFYTAATNRSYTLQNADTR